MALVAAAVSIAIPTANLFSYRAVASTKAGPQSPASKRCTSSTPFLPRLLYSIGHVSRLRAPPSPRSKMTVTAEGSFSLEKPAENPLLADAGFPLFDKVNATHVVPAMKYLLTELGEELAQLENNVQPSWDSLAHPLEKIGDKLGIAWGVVGHLKAVKDTEALRKAVEEVQPEKVAFTLRMAQSKPIYEAFKAIRNSDKWATLSEAQQRIVEAELRDGLLGGVALEGEKKERFNAIQQELSQLSLKFSNNLMDATKAFQRLVTDKAEVKGLPATALTLGAQTAKAKGHEAATPEEGPWVFTLDMPSFMAIMQNAESRPLREEMYRAYVSRASSGDGDNQPVIERILALKHEKAQLLGYDNFAEVSMASKMATLQSAQELLEKLRVTCVPAAKKDLEELKAFAKEHGMADAESMTHWDFPYWSERLRESKFNIKEEELRPYFALPNVLEGLFGLAHDLFGITVEAADGEAPVWHKDVRFHRVRGADGKRVAYFFLDPYSRPEEKRGGAWMGEVYSRSRLFAPPGSDVRLPAAHMVCNQMVPLDGKPSLMTFREVETLFHEFGHALQHMLTTQEEGLCTGIRNVEWDAVELPSQFMENWCYHRPVLMSFAHHYETGEPLPEEIFQRLCAAKNFRAGTMMLRQLHFAFTDLQLHSNYVPDGTPG
eukprot:jgi/Mesvir1/20091/Mv13335-RA.1